MPVTVTRTTITTTTSSSTTVGSARALTQPLGLLRLLQLISTCVAFSLVASVGAWTGPMGNWAMFTWCFCFAVTLIILIVELGGLQAHFPLSWRNFPITFACYAALFCLSSSIICFILAGVTILLNLGDCTNVLPIPFPTFLSGLALLSVLFYATAIVLWPLYQFDQRYQGQPRRSMDPSCTRSISYIQPNTVCFWDRRLAVSILTGINLLAYVSDLVYSTRLVFVKV